MENLLYLCIRKLNIMKIHKSTVRKDIENKLEVYSIGEIIEDCRVILKELKKYGNENDYQLKYYKIFWQLLSEY